MKYGNFRLILYMYNPGICSYFDAVILYVKFVPLISAFQKSMKLKIRVEDMDPRNNDFVESLRTFFDTQPAPSKSEAVETRVIVKGRTRWVYCLNTVSQYILFL